MDDAESRERKKKHVYGLDKKCLFFCVKTFNLATRFTHPTTGVHIISKRQRGGGGEQEQGEGGM